MPYAHVLGSQRYVKNGPKPLTSNKRPKGNCFTNGSSSNTEGQTSTNIILKYIGGYMVLHLYKEYGGFPKQGALIDR